MALFAKRVTDVVAIEDETINIQMLSGRSLEKAALQRQITAAQMTKSFGPEVAKAFAEEREEKNEKGEKKEPTKEERRKAVYALYDRHSVLLAGIVSWSMEEKVNEESISGLTDEVATKIFEAIIDLSVRDDEEDRKKEF